MKGSFLLSQLAVKIKPLIAAFWIEGRWPSCKNSSTTLVTQRASTLSDKFNVNSETRYSILLFTTNHSATTIILQSRYYKFYPAQRTQYSHSTYTFLSGTSQMMLLVIQKKRKVKLVSKQTAEFNSFHLHNHRLLAWTFANHWAPLCLHSLFANQS